MGEPARAVIVAALRTPVGRFGGTLSGVRPDDLGAAVIRVLVRTCGLDPSSIDDVYWGCANQAGEDNRNVGRMSVLLAGLPHAVPAATVNRLCGSSLEAVVQAARAVCAGDADTVIAGGVESMSRAPYALPRTGSMSAGSVTAFDTALGWRFPNPALERIIPLESMGETAENVAERWHITRAEQDAFALESHRRAVAARDAGIFSAEIIPVDVPGGTQGTVSVAQDECPRPDTSLEKLAALPPVFRAGGTVTAGNSSPLNDGAAGVIVMSEARARSAGLAPLARIASSGVAGVDPRTMGIGPVPATRTALRRAGITMGDVGTVELNEAFAAQALAVIRDLEVPFARVNPYGGAIALGHPLGASGARILTTLLNSMRRTGVQWGVATMCIGVGQGITVVLENMRPA
ncbi:MAG TPA: thiolase family protein [Bacteroidota bacterium]|nr:thiolase family protein [Bacteroidota bacterium]